MPILNECEDCKRLMDQVDRAERLDQHDPARMQAVADAWQARDAHMDEHRKIAHKAQSEREAR